MKHPWACLVTLKSGEGYYSHIMAKQGFTVGRSSDADVPILDPRVSRTHLTVDLEGEFVYIKDHESVNGTFVNEIQLSSGERKIVRSEDVIRLGKYTGKLQFRSIPAPFQILEKSHPSFKAALTEFSEEIEKNIRHAIEKDLAHQRKQAEESRETAKEQAAKDREKAKKEAEEIVAEAEEEIERELEETSERCDEQLEEAQRACSKLIEEANDKAQKTIMEARAEAEKLGIETRAEAERLVTAARAEVEKINSTARSDAEKATASAHEEALKVAAEARAAAAKLTNDARADAEKLMNDARSEGERLTKKAASKYEELVPEITNKLRAEMETERREIIDRARTEMKLEKENFGKLLEDRVQTGHEKIQKKLKDMEEKTMADLEDLRRSEEEKYEKMRRDLSRNLTDALTDRFFEMFEDYFAEFEMDREELRDEIQDVIKASLSPKKQADKAVKLEWKLPKIKIPKMSRWMKISAFVAFLLGLSFAEFNSQISSNETVQTADESRQIQSVYSPPKTDRYQSNYTDNVLLMRGYFGAKVDLDNLEKWRKELTQLDLEISKEATRKFLAKESELIQNLGKLRDKIDGANPDATIDKMRKLEEKGVTEFKVLLGGDANYSRVRAAERDFLESLNK